MKKLSLLFIFLFLIAHQAQAASGPCADFFYGIGCPHCEAVKPFITQLAEDNPSWQINWYEVYQNQDNGDILTKMFAKHDITRGGVPIVFVGDSYIIGDNPIKQNLEEAMQKQSVYTCPTDFLTSDQVSNQPPINPRPTKIDAMLTEPDVSEVFGALEQETKVSPPTEGQVASESAGLPEGVVAYTTFGLLVILAAVFIIRNRK